MKYAHGTLEAYLRDECRDDPCKAAWNIYRQRRSRQMAYGRWEPYVDAEPARAHVAALVEQDMTYGLIAVLAGVSNSTVTNLMEGDSRRGGYLSPKIRPETSRKILAVRPNLDDLSRGVLIDATGSRRRVQALAAIGYSVKEQAIRVGRAQPNYRRIFVYEQVTAETARLVRGLYDEWSMTPAPPSWVSERTKRWAARQGFLPPLAWDEELIDLPDSALQAEVRRQASEMTYEELAYCYTARREHGDTSPLVVAGALEYGRRSYRRQKAAAQT